MATRFFPRYDSNLIISRFGMRVHPITRINTMHNGIDINATADGKTGQTDYITAHTGGTVEAVGYGLSAGNYIKIRTDSRTVMVYYHMKNKSALKKGAAVQKGDRLGYVGKTGSATGPHLHFGIQLDGKWIDPEPYLDKDWTQTEAVDLPVLRRGCKGECVKAMQLLLNLRLGSRIEPLDVDGSFGAKTLAAVNTCKGKADNLCDGDLWKILLGL